MVFDSWREPSMCSALAQRILRPCVGPHLCAYAFGLVHAFARIESESPAKATANVFRIIRDGVRKLCELLCRVVCVHVFIPIRKPAANSGTSGHTTIYLVSVCVCGSVVLRRHKWPHSIRSCSDISEKNGNICARYTHTHDGNRVFFTGNAAIRLAPMAYCETRACINANHLHCAHDEALK